MKANARKKTASRKCAASVKPESQPEDFQEAEPAASTRRAGARHGNPAAPRVLTYSDIDISRWRDYEHVETDSLWMFSGRDRSHGHQLDYHGNCIPQILTQLLTRYTREREVVLDLFLGSGTSAIEAANLGRRAVGVELNPEIATYVRSKLEEQGKSGDATVIQGDSRNAELTGPKIQAALEGFDRTQAQFLFLHPPYADIIRFSDNGSDLSNAPTTEAFLDMFSEVCELGYRQLEPGRFAGLVIGDKYADGEWIPLGFYCLERMNRAGFKTKSIIVKNISGNEKAKGRTNNLWRYRALVGGFYVFRHEYVMLFQKPAKPR